MPTIKIPRAMQKLLVAQADEVFIQASTVLDCIQVLVAEHPRLKEYLMTENNQPSAFVNIYCGRENVRFSPEKVLNIDDVLEIVPAMSGG